MGRVFLLQRYISRATEYRGHSSIDSVTFHRISGLLNHPYSAYRSWRIETSPILYSEWRRCKVEVLFEIFRVLIYCQTMDEQCRCDCKTCFEQPSEALLILTRWDLPVTGFLQIRMPSRLDFQQPFCRPALHE